MKPPTPIEQLLQLRWPPVALAFRATPPANVPHVDTPAPSGCTFWKRAAEGRTFYTEAPDHYNCPIGSYTHGIALPPQQMNELQQVVGTMVGLGYLRMEEVPGIPKREDGFGVAVYSPLAEAPCEPDVILVRGNVKQVMLLSEAAQAAGFGVEGGLMGRPTCASIPAVLKSGHSSTNLACIGNRVYTDLGDDELYFALPGKALAAVTEKLAIILKANQELEKYHHQRRSAIQGERNGK
jgi:uncharacterized protein (DUF169 family)